MPLAAWPARGSRARRAFLPGPPPLALLDSGGMPTGQDELSMPGPDVLVGLHSSMVIGRRFDTQATALARQGRLAVYPSSRGQEACQVGVVHAMRAQDWLFPTYRHSAANIFPAVGPADGPS